MPAPPAASSDALGDPADWVDRHGDALLRFAAARVADRELAEDLVQETFLTALRHRDQFDGKSAFATWLIAILKRKIIDHFRKSSRTPQTSAQPLVAAEEPFGAGGRWTASLARWQASPQELAENAEFWTVFHECLGGLPKHLAQAFQLRELGMTSVDETCQLIGVTPGNVAVRLHRARLLLRQCLESKWFGGQRGEPS